MLLKMLFNSLFTSLTYGQKILDATSITAMKVRGKSSEERIRGIAIQSTFSKLIASSADIAKKEVLKDLILYPELNFLNHDEPDHKEYAEAFQELKKNMLIAKRHIERLNSIGLMGNIPLVEKIVRKNPRIYCPMANRLYTQFRIDQTGKELNSFLVNSAIMCSDAIG